jgi:ParB/RepB/Spo0J family partition protein
MTSGNFAPFPVDQITVNREARQRQEDLNVDDLIPSIRDRGLINPIVIKRDGELVAGERRLTAVRSLGWTHISVQFVEDLDPIVLHLIELEENVKRKNLTWQEECLAVKRYHELQSSLDPEWTQESSAEALGVTQAYISQHIDIGTEIAAGNTRVAEAPKLSTARSITIRAAQRKRNSVIAEILDEPEDRSIPLINEDFIEWAKAYSGPKFNFLHCDFPYGVNADEHNQGSASNHGGYADGFDVYERLIEALRASMDSVVAESAHIMFWFSMDYYEFTRLALSDMGWRVNPFPLIWHKSDNTGILPDVKRGPRRIYETAFFGSRGDRFVVAPISNVVAHPVTKTIHMSEKPVAMLKNFFRMFVDSNSMVLDPTCGSGNSIKAAQQSGASFSLGIEKDEEFFTLAKEHFFDEDI